MKIGLALGSGAARGVAHIGVIKELEDNGLVADVISGSSIGSVVGAIHSLGYLDDFEAFLRSLSRTDIIRYMGPSLFKAGGIASAERLMTYFADNYGKHMIQDMPLPFSAVATELHYGREVWLRSGDLWSAVRASMSMPGVLTPMYLDDRWLVDGGLVNPIPISTCRAMGADFIIGVNINGDLLGLASSETEDIAEEIDSDTASIMNRLGYGIKNIWRSSDSDKDDDEEPDSTPSSVSVMMNSINIMQDRVTRSRLAGEPADIVLAPRVRDIGLIEFNEVERGVEEGRMCVQRMLPAIQYALDSRGLKHLRLGKT